MNRALCKMTDAEREADIAHDKVLIARVLQAMNEPLHMEPPPARQAKKRAPEGAVVAYILIFAAASVSLAIAAWLGGVL